MWNFLVNREMTAYRKIVVDPRAAASGPIGDFGPAAVVDPKRQLGMTAPGASNHPCACVGTLRLPMTMRKATSIHMQV